MPLSQNFRLENAVPQLSRERSGGTFPSRERIWESATVVAMCYAGSRFLLTGGLSTLEMPVIGVPLVLSSAITAAACPAFAMITFNPLVPDAQVKSFHEYGGIFTGGLFVAPIGALIAGDKGMRAAADFGALLTDTVGMRFGIREVNTIYKHKDWFELGKLVADSIGLFNDDKAFGDDLIHFGDKSSADQDHPAGPLENPSLQGITPPGMGDLNDPRDRGGILSTHPDPDEDETE
jgi:hypothetical protein